MKQINFILLTFLTILLLSSCKTETIKEVERISLTTEVITDSIYTRMPGRLFMLGEHLVWEDPFGSEDGFMHVIDIKSKKEVGVMGKKGQGPKEFSTPAVSKASGSTLFVIDLNTKRQAFFSLNNLLSSKDYYIPLSDATEERISSKLQLDNKSFVSLNPTKHHLFKMEKDESIVEFGIPYINIEFDNPYDIYQGAMEMNENKQKFVFSSFRLPYIEIYDMKGKMPSLIYASEISSDAYSMEGTNLKPNSQKKGAVDLALLKDYIVTIQRDYEIDNTDESTVRMDFEKLPTTVFLYNYKGELQKIVDVGIPILRIAGDAESNNLYAVGVDPEFVLVKCEL